MSLSSVGMDDEYTWEHLTSPPRAIGVIVGVSMSLTPQDAERVLDHLTDRFPGVTFAVVGGASSISFPLPDLEDEEAD